MGRLEITRRRLALSVAIAGEVVGGLVAAESSSKVLFVGMLVDAIAIGALTRQWFGPAVALGAVAPGVLVGASQPGSDNESFAQVLGMELTVLVALAAAAALGAGARGGVRVWRRRRGGPTPQRHGA